MPIVTLFAQNYRTNNFLHSFTTHLETPIHNASEVALLNISYPEEFFNILSQTWYCLDNESICKEKIITTGTYAKSLEDVFTYIDDYYTSVSGVKNLLDFSIRNGRVLIQNKSNWRIDLAQVGSLLGFYGLIEEGLNIAQHNPDILYRNHNVLVFSDIVSPQPFIESSIPLLDRIPMTMSHFEHKSIIHYEKSCIQYKETSKSYIDRITIKFFNQNGDVFHFADSSGIYITIDIKTNN